MKYSISNTTKAALMLLLFISGFASAQCDPLAFELSVTNPTCKGNDGSIKVVDISGTGPFTIVGAGNNFEAGSHIVTVKDACGVVRTRSVTLSPYLFDFSYTIEKATCSTAVVSISSSTSSRFTYEVNGIISSSPTITLPLTRNYTIKVTDSCGNVVIRNDQQPDGFVPYIKKLNERIECTFQEIFPEYYGFQKGATVCCYRYPQNTLVECRTVPSDGYSGGSLTNFFNLPFGQDYYVIVQDGCYRDSAFFKDKTSAGGSQLDPFAWHCNTFDLHSDGNNSGITCLYRQSDNSLVECKPNSAPFQGGINPATGQGWKYGGSEFYNLPYGCYYTYIFDPCDDTLVRIDTCVTYPFKSFATTFLNCSDTQSAVAVNYSPEAPMPWTTFVYWPNDSLVGTFVSSGFNWNHHFPTYPFPGKYKVITQDGCGKRDTSYLEQHELFPRRTVEVKGGCPGLSGASGGGDIVVHGNKAYRGSNIKITSKDGAALSLSQTYSWYTESGADIYFTNLSSGTYVLESSLGCYGFKIYDTVVVKPYEYPRQMVKLESCGTGFLNFKDTITGGVAPYTYQMLTPYPFTQNHGAFTIGVDTITRVELKVTDLCGNSHNTSFTIGPSSCAFLPLVAPATQRRIENKNIVIYPNPSNQQFTISFSSKKKADYTVDMINSIGHKVLHQRFAGIDQKSQAIHHPFIPPGAYIIRITNHLTGEIESRKHIIQ